MTAKHLLFRAEARAKILTGAGQLADAVRVTLGPKSKSVLIQRRWGVPLVCNDGVTIARETELEDAQADLGARMLRQAAEKTGEAVGDGTSTATVLAYAILADGIRMWLQAQAPSTSRGVWIVRSGGFWKVYVTWHDRFRVDLNVPRLLRCQPTMMRSLASWSLKPWTESVLMV